MNILLIRHAKTEGNLEKRYIGRKTDQPILFSENEHIQELAGILQRKLPDNYLLFSSPLLRCRMTAEGLTGRKDYCICPDLTEIDFGIFEGKNYIELSDNEVYQRWIDSDGKLPFPEGESREGFEERSVAAFKQIIFNTSADDFAVIVCHGGSIMSIMSGLTGRQYFDFSIPNLDGFFLEVGVDRVRGVTDVLSYSRLCDWLIA